MSFSISAADLAAFHEDYAGRKDSAVLERAVTKNGVKSASFDWHSKADNDQHFSIDLSTGNVADQKQSGRCWMFAALNTMRTTCPTDPRLVAGFPSAKPPSDHREEGWRSG